MANPLGSHSVNGLIGDIGPMARSVSGCQTWQIWETFLWRIRRLTLLFLSITCPVYNLSTVWTGSWQWVRHWGSYEQCTTIQVESFVVMPTYSWRPWRGHWWIWESLSWWVKHLKCHIQQVLWQVWGLVPTKHIWVKQSLPVFSYLL